MFDITQLTLKKEASKYMVSEKNPKGPAAWPHTNVFLPKNKGTS